MRALVDRHQADLFYALQILLEDRCGIEVYTPIGYEWFDEGYWQFGHQHLGRALADQYLGIDAKYELYRAPWPEVPDVIESEGCYATLDPAHPDRVIRCVTRAQFDALGGWTASHRPQGGRARISQARS